MNVLLLILMCASLISFVGWNSAGGRAKERRNIERRRIDQAKQDALDDIRRRRERAEDQLRRLSRWQR